MDMVAINKRTGELRPCNTDDLKGLYYTLDKRLWDFEPKAKIVRVFKVSGGSYFEATDPEIPAVTGEGSTWEKASNKLYKGATQ